MKRKVGIIVICIIVIMGILVRNAQLNKVRNEKTEEEKTYELMQRKVTRAEAAKMLSLAGHTSAECNELDYTISYKDVKEDAWFSEYVNAVNFLGLMKEREYFRPEERLTYEEAKEILEKYKLKDYKRLAFQFDKERMQKDITLQDWLSVYEYICTELYNYVPEKKDVYIVMAGAGEKGKKDNFTVIGENERYSAKGVSLQQYLDKTVTVVVKDHEILAVEQVKSETVSLENVWIKEAKGKEIEVFINGVERKFKSDNRLEKEVSSVLGDLILANQRVTKVSIKPDVITGKVLAVTDKYIELKNYGKIPIEDNYKVYKTYGEMEIKSPTSVLVGYEISDFVVSEDKISAALIKESPKAENIRVLLKTSGYNDIFHSSVVVTSSEPFTIKYGKSSKTYKAKQKVTLKPTSKVFNAGRITIIPKDGEKIQVDSISRSYGVPSYRGRIEVAVYDKKLVLVNELPLEQYLYSVVPSEMPTSYGMEALRVQAVCARSYAYNQLMGNKYSQYGAHVDDSTFFQVYNNVEENESSIKAVKDTYGKVLEYEGAVITAYYFSTSSGYTSSANEVWMNNTPITYLTGKLQVEAGQQKEIDLTDEKIFRDFLLESKYKTFDSNFAWYRWHTSVSLQELKTTIDRKLMARYTANSSLIKTLKNGEYVSIPVDTVGDIKDIQVTKRATGGVATEIIIKGTKNTVKVISEYNIRILLSPSGNDVVRQDTSRVPNMSLLPSAFILLDRIVKDDKLAGYKISGGGYGHGVGMSQNGVKTMAEQGFTYEDILKHYYSGVEIKTIY